MQRSFCLYIPCTAHAAPHKVYTTAWGICFSVHFLMVFADTRFTMSATSLYAFLVSYNQAQFVNADFERLGSNV